MTHAIKSELLKLLTTRLWWGMAIGIALSSAGFAVLFGFLFTSVDPANAGPGFPMPSSDVELVNSVYSAGIGIGYLLTLCVGIMHIGMEYRHKTITSTFLSTPKRARAMAAKVASLLIIGAGYGLLSVISGVIPGAIVLSIQDVDPFPSGAVFRTMALMLLVLGLWALMGLGAGILIPNQIAALLIAVGVAWIVEPLAGLLLSAWSFGADNIAPYLPSAATQAVLSGSSTPGMTMLSWWGGALTLLVWAAVLSGIGTFRAVRQDVS